MSVRFARISPGRPARSRTNRRRSPGGRPRRPVLAVVAVALLVLAATGAWRVASYGDGQPPRPAPTIVRCLLEPVELASLSCTSAILVEAETGTVLWEKNADARRAPASLVKMMLELVVFEDIAAGRVSLADSVTTSANASTMGGSQVFLRHGEVQTLESMLNAIGIASANDAAMAVAEHLSGSEAAFVERMNVRARELGCDETTFGNVHGLDLRKDDRNWTSARDLSRIACELTRYPQAIAISSTWREPFRGGAFWLDNTNKLLKRFDGLDGLKTGWTPRAGGCFVGTAVRDRVRLVAVVLASNPGRARFDVTARLLEAGYARGPRWVEVFRTGDPLPELLDTGMEAPPAAGGTVRLLWEADRDLHLTPRFRPGTGEPEAPLGWVDLRVDGRTVATVPARTADS